MDVHLDADNFVVSDYPFLKDVEVTPKAVAIEYDQFTGSPCTNKADSTAAAENLSSPSVPKIVLGYTIHKKGLFFVMNGLQKHGYRVVAQSLKGVYIHLTLIIHEWKRLSKNGKGLQNHWP